MLSDGGERKTMEGGPPRVGELVSYYDSYWSPEGFGPSNQWSEDLQRFLSTISRGACLDVGCGDGTTAGPWLRGHVRDYHGVDISPVAVRQARRLGLRAETIEVGAPLPFPDATFDSIICLEVLEHQFAPLDACVEMLRVLKPGGALFATVPNIAYWRRRLEALAGVWNPLGDGQSISEPWRDPHIRFFTAAGLRRMLLSAGLGQVVVTGHGGHSRDDPYTVRVKRRLKDAAPSMFGYRLYARGVRA